MAETQEQEIRVRLAKEVYAEAEDLREFTLKRAGILEGLAANSLRHTVAVTSRDRRLSVSVGLGSQLTRGFLTTRLIEVVEKPQPGEGLGFSIERYFEEDGTVWVQADSSQGQPWLPVNLGDIDLVGMIERFSRLREGPSDPVVTLFPEYLPPQAAAAKIA